MINLRLIIIFFLLAFAANPGVCAEDKSPVVTDKAGRTVTVDRPFERIISLYAAHTENLFELGLDEEIIGVNAGEQGKRLFSHRDGLEKFLVAEPDLVLVRPMIDKGYPGLIKGLDRKGIQVMSFQPSTVDEMFKYWMDLGALTGRKERASEMTALFMSKVERCKAATASVQVRKRVYFEAIHSKMRTFSPNAMAIFALETAGGVNAAPDAEPRRGANIASYSKERIMAGAERIDVFLAQKGAMNQPTLEMIYNEPGFSVIKAIREKQVYIIDEEIVSRPTLRLIQGVHEIGSILYPEVFGKGGPR